MIYSKSQTFIKGLDELIDAFGKLPADALEYVKAASMDAAQDVCNRAKELVPSDTGKTKASLYVKKPTKSQISKHQVFSVISAKKGSAPLAPLELGHKLVYMGHKTDAVIQARPFLRPAADEKKEEVVNKVADAMNGAVEKMGGVK